ncbi:hypothetical protein Ancab_035717 [Ancistrocladus abbreviatus]
MDGPVNPELSAWISRAIVHVEKLNMYESQVRTRGKCHPDIKVGLKIDRKFRELEMLIANGQRISKKSATRGNIRQEINTIGSAVEEVKGAIWRDMTRGVVGTISIHRIACVDLQRVQEDIARSISINLPPDSNINTSAAILRTALTGKNRFLLILDSMWQGYSPSDIGIPELTRGCNLIVTSRIFSMFNSFRGRKLYEIKPLVVAYAWNLFAYEAGSDVVLNLPEHILTRTKTAIQDLQGMPLAITKVAKTLRNIYKAPWEWADIVAEWKEVLDCLSRSATFLENKNHKLVSSLRKSYQNLRVETR